MTLLTILTIFKTVLRLKEGLPPLAGVLINYVAVAVFGVAIPIVAAVYIHCCDRRVLWFEIWSSVSSVVLVMLSVWFVRSNFTLLRREQSEQAAKVPWKLKKRVILIVWVLACLALTSVAQILRFIHGYRASFWKAFAACLGSEVACIYWTLVVLTACLLFAMLCEQHITHADQFVQLLTTNGDDEAAALSKHSQLSKSLLELSKGSSFYIISLTVIVMVNQMFSIVVALGSKVAFTNTATYVASTAIQFGELALCLFAGRSISENSQGIRSEVSKWYARCYCLADSRLAQSTSDLYAYLFVLGMTLHGFTTQKDSS